MTTRTPNPHPPPIHPISYHSLSPTLSRWVPLRAIDIHSLHSLGMFDNGKPIYHLLNHPIKWVRITGVVVAMDEFSERRILTVDDSSGSCIECVCAVPPATSISTAAVPGHLNQNQNQFQVQVSYTKGSSKSGQAGRGKEAQKEEKGQKNKTKDQPSAQNPLIPWQDVDVGSVLKIKGQITTFRDVKQVDVIKIDIIRGTDAEVKCWEEVYNFRQTVLSKPWVVSEVEGRACDEKARVDVKKGKERSDRSEGKGAGRMKESGREDGGSKSKRKGETEKERRHRHGAKKQRNGKGKEAEGLDPANKINYPSIAVRRRVAGKYDTLGI